MQLSAEDSGRLEVYATELATELDLQRWQVLGALRLLSTGATVPFISRYRQEATGNLDEVAVEALETGLRRLTELSARKRTIVETIEGQGKLTAALRGAIEATWDATVLEDLYQPYKPRRTTRAVRARERGLEPLAVVLREGKTADVEAAAARYVTAEVPTVSDALQGARDIVAEWVADDAPARELVRNAYKCEAVATTRVAKGKEAEAGNYSDYFERREPLSRCPSHRVLAMLRGEQEGLLKLTVELPDDEPTLRRLRSRYVQGAAAAQLQMAVDDSYKRLLAPSMATWATGEAKRRADTEAIAVFQTNLRQLLLSPPLGHQRVLALDPGFRTGCKLVCLDEQGALLAHDVIFPHPPKAQPEQAARTVMDYINSYNLTAVAIGNGTASRETEAFVRGLPGGDRLHVYVVSEDGASIYSASATAREEFPDQDVTVRGAVSIGRRLLDPLAELVKIDPGALGVGQYQHDVDTTRLREALDAVVLSCVNLVGVDVNTASWHLLSYVSGLGPQLARGIVAYRTANGPFATKRDLLKVPRLGPKAFEQCAGFLRIPGAGNPLDATAVHPERYPLVEQMASELFCTVGDLIANPALRRKIDVTRYITAEVGVPTLKLITDELSKPGRDPRPQLQEFAFDPTVHTIDDLRPGMTLPGIVTNITNFGAFVDVGVKTDGLVHISQLGDHFVHNVADEVKLHQSVTVRVLEVDLARKRITLSMKGLGIRD